MDGCTRVLLVINAENYTAWNARKQLVMTQLLAHDHELAFLDVVIGKHHKCPHAWTHRFRYQPVIA